MSYKIRTYGDPVLKTKAAAVDNVDGKVIRLVDEMFDTLVESGNGLALAAPQIGVQKQVVVWDIDDEPLAIINPEIVESDGEWTFDEGCLSIPGLYVEMLRPKQVLVRGVSLDGEIIEIEADELAARMFQHEIDHLKGVLMFDRLEGDQRKEAMREYRRIEEQAAAGVQERQPLRKRLGFPELGASPMKLVYLGTPEMAVPPLRALHDAGHDIVLVVTRVDKKRGRGGALSQSPVKAAARELGLSVSHDPDDVLTAVIDDGAELGVVVAYGRMIKPHVLDLIPMVNAHFSLLPRWRGAAPVERALLAGDGLTGVDIMRLEEGLDTGGIYAETVVPIGSTTTAAELRAELVGVACDLLIETLSRPVQEWIDSATDQVGETVYASKFGKGDFEIDWEQPAEQVHRLVRVGGAWTTFRGKRLQIHAADLIAGELVPTVVQPEGKAQMGFDAWRNGAQPTSDELFGNV